MKSEGLWGLYKSYPVTVLMNIPFASCVITVNENMKTVTRPWDRQNPLLWYFFCAGISGGMAGLMTNPLDVIKTRLQTNSVEPTCKRMQELFNKANLAKDKSSKCCCPHEARSCPVHISPAIRLTEFLQMGRQIYF